MILYHYTSVNFLDSIRSEGLTRGEVPLSANRVINGVWLTTDSNPEGHGLSDGEEISKNDIAILKARGLLAGSVPENVPLRYADKRSARITVKISSNDRDLKHWPIWGRKRLSPKWYEALADAGGGSQKVRTWYVCFRTILPDEFIAVDVLRAARDDTEEQ